MNEYNDWKRIMKMNRLIINKISHKVCLSMNYSDSLSDIHSFSKDYIWKEKKKQLFKRSLFYTKWYMF